jgi:hypothetical protein
MDSALSGALGPVFGPLAGSLEGPDDGHSDVIPVAPELGHLEQLGDGDDKARNSGWSAPWLKWSSRKALLLGLKESPSLEVIGVST